MKVALFDEEHEKDLEKEVNRFLSSIDDEQLVDIKFSVAASCDSGGEQVYCFSAMVMYRP
ncbi:sporulation protein Cse60 [Metabacillus sp. KIGAM252]|uniref:Sporulation protein Cse60 n=1 Tax=Metabacillus flavus TaxID=2823519 RepID=A0ABS5LH96_9BACI|nr:sporulation protein Cse60 [Metabacillus flavus]MBS2970108.1 sporulation protein Cse60 [Metabacillus flavus]